jgi:hypothetical protein
LSFGLAVEVAFFGLLHGYGAYTPLNLLHCE